MAALTEAPAPKTDATGTSRKTGSDGASAQTGAPPHISGIQ